MSQTGEQISHCSGLWWSLELSLKLKKKTETEKIVAPLRLLQKHYHSSEIAYFHLNCDCSFDRLLTSWPDHPSERDTDLKRIFFPLLIQYSFKCLFKGDFSLNAKFDPSHLSVLKFKDDLELQTEKQALSQRLFFPHHFISRSVGERCLDLPALLSKSSHLRGYEAHRSYCVAGRRAEISELHKEWLHPAACGPDPGFERGKQEKKAGVRLSLHSRQA